jgi:hypothetical protein
MIFAETQRLVLRALTKDDLPVMVELIGHWDVARWLAVVPHPYTMNDAEDYFVKMQAAYASGKPEYFCMIRKQDNQFMGSVGLHAPRLSIPDAQAVEIGYWLGKPYWNNGYMTEAVKAVVDLGFRRPEVDCIVSTTDPDNIPSQNLLRKLGFNYLGIFARTDDALRGGAEITSWRIGRDYNQKGIQS